MRFTRLDAWLAWQESCHPKEIDLGLERVRQVAELMGLLTPQGRVITVAGTNGKGSCVATLERLLLSCAVSEETELGQTPNTKAKTEQTRTVRGKTTQGATVHGKIAHEKIIHEKIAHQKLVHKKTVGAYTSPHLLRYNERIRINGVAASDDDICAAFAAIDEARGHISLSYFEFGTLAAFWLFQRYQVDYWILEVGLGGRLDATNIVDADIAVITSIAIDHQQYLGDNREAIGREKAGILRSGKPVVCADLSPPHSVVAYAHELQCPLYIAGDAFTWQAGDDHWQLNLKDATGKSKSLALPLPQLPLPSVAAAFEVSMLLGHLDGIDDSSLAQVCETIRLEGRFQQITCADIPVYFDVAHNPAAAEFLAQQLEAKKLKRLGIVVAMMADKDIEASLRPLQPFVHHWWLAGLPDMARAAIPSVLADTLTHLGVASNRLTTTASVADAITAALSGGLAQHQCEALLVTGSFYTVSAALQQCAMPLKKEH